MSLERWLEKKRRRDASWQPDKVVYSLYIDIPKEELDDMPPYKWDNISKSERTKLQMNLYFEKLRDAQKDYAKKIGADYFLFRWDEEYAEFHLRMRSLQPTMSYYDILNFWKVHLFTYLSEHFDKVLYLDFDVIPNTDEDFFEAHDVKNTIAIAHFINDAIFDVNTERVIAYDIRNPVSKYWNTHAMLHYRSMEYNGLVYNTAIMGGTSNSIDKLQYFFHFEELLEYMRWLQTDDHSMYPSKIRQGFGFDNETVFNYRVNENNTPMTHLDQNWHHMIMGSQEITPQAKLIHFINKRFDMYWKEDEAVTQPILVVPAGVKLQTERVTDTERNWNKPEPKPGAGPEPKKKVKKKAKKAKKKVSKKK